MPSVKVSQGHAATASLVVIRADGTREDVGIVATYHRNPMRRLYLALRHRLGLPIREEHVFGSRQRRDDSG